MEIIELVSYFLNEETKILEVSFRMLNDSDETIRIDKVDYTLAEEYGYELISEDFDIFSDDDDSEFDDFDLNYLDKDELISFLNEYYAIHPEKIPDCEFY
jgi:hypothetical protein